MGKNFLLQLDRTYGNTSGPFKKNVKSFTKTFNSKKFGDFRIPWNAIYTDIDEIISISKD